MTSTGYNDFEKNDYMEKLIAEVVKSDDFKRVTSSMVHVFLNNWAGESNAKKWIANPVEKRLKKALLAPDTSDGVSSEGASTIGDLIDPIAALANDMLGRMGQFAKTIEDLPSDEKEKLLEKVSANINTSQIGDIIGTVTRIIKTDDRIGFIPIINAGANKLLEVMTNLNKSSSDDIAEKSFAQVENLDGVAIGQLVNETIRVVKKLQKGTEFMKDPDFLSTESDIINKVEEIGNEIDIGFLIKSRMAIEEYKESLKGWLMS